MPVFAMLQGTAETDTLTTQSAMAIAQCLKVSLTGLLALPDPQAALMVVTSPEASGLSAATSMSLVDMQKDMIEKAERAFKAVVEGAGQPIEHRFRHQVGTAEHAAASAATLAEAVVFPRSASSTGEPLSLAFDHVMMDERLPIVLTGNKAFEPGPVIIGWDGSNGASRAVRFHAPLITAFGEVIIAQNQKDAERDGARPSQTAGTLEHWLTRRGVNARYESLEGGVAAGLLALAARTGATMIVAGAYGHSRLGERLFGGTSRRLLEADAAPALALAR